MIYVAAGMAAFVMVFLKAMQQLNVVKHKVWWVPPFSYGMEAANILIVWNIAQRGWEFWLWFSLGTGAWMGAILAMKIHKRFA